MHRCILYTHKYVCTHTYIHIIYLHVLSTISGLLHLDFAHLRFQRLSYFCRFRLWYLLTSFHSLKSSSFSLSFSIARIVSRGHVDLSIPRTTRQSSSSSSSSSLSSSSSSSLPSPSLFVSLLHFVFLL